MLDKYRYGFRASHSTLNHLVKIAVHEAFVNRQFCVSVFFDLEKAYDTTWRHDIIQDLYNSGIRGRILSAVISCLGRRTFRLKLDSTLSKEFVQDNGVPQGGVLSVTLFIVKMNSLSRVMPSMVHYSLYVDDLQISVSSCNLSICERRL